MDSSEGDQVYVEVMVAFDGLDVGARAFVRADWFEGRRQYLKPLLRRRQTGDPDGPGGDLPAED